MGTLVDLTDSERAFLKSMADVTDMSLGLGIDEVTTYKSKYGCDPCDACGPDACSNCTGCAENYVSFGQINPFGKISL
jgi:hypothetical protein